MREINPLNDFAFKKIFGEKGREFELKTFLEAILKIELEEIEILESKEANKGYVRRQMRYNRH